MTEVYPPLPLSPTTSPNIMFPTTKQQSPPFRRASFSPGYIRTGSVSVVYSASSPPIAASPSAPSLRCHSQSRGHRHTKSLNSHCSPLPLPLPEDQVEIGYTSNKEDSDDRAESIIRQWRLKRSGTIPPRSSVERTASFSTLPDNPKLWTPSQLAQYLLTALRFKSSKSSDMVAVPRPIAQDIAKFVIKCKLNGRTFLRLAEKDMEDLGVNKLWRATLLSSSLELRKSLLKGRIWGFGSGEDINAAINTHPTPGQGRRIPSTVHEREEVISQASLSISPVQLSCSRSEGIDSHQLEGFLSRSSSAIGLESDASECGDFHRYSRSRAQSTSSIASSGVGRVQEMVRNLERASTTSDIAVVRADEEAEFASGKVTPESEDQEHDIAGNNTITFHAPAQLGPSSDEQIQSSILDPSISRSVDSPLLSQSSNESDYALIETPALPSSPRLPIVDQPGCPSILPLHASGDAKGAALNEEPTIEALLREEEGSREGRFRATSWGARAWEAEFPEGTSRRVLASPPITRSDAKLLTECTTTQREMIVVSRAVWDDLSRRLEESERRLTLLERQDVGFRKGAVVLNSDAISVPDELEPSQPGGLSAATLPPYLIIVGVGVCALVAQAVFGRMTGRRPHL